MQARLDNALGLRRTSSRDSIISFAGSINTKKVYKKFCKGLFDSGVTAEMITQNEGEIRKMLHSQNTATATSSQLDLSTIADQSQVPEVGNPCDANSTAETAPIPTISTENKPSQNRSRFSWIRPSIDFLVGPLMLDAAEAGNTKRLISTLQFVQNVNFAVGDRKETALHKAAAKGHTNIMELLLMNGASGEAMDQEFSALLHDAASSGHTRTVELLLTKGASIEARSEDRRTPLHCAASSGHTNTVELLLTKGASIEARGILQHTPLHYAADRGHTSTVELLLTKGASTEAVNRYGDTPLHHAAMSGHTNTVELLLTQGASIEAMNTFDDTPSDLAALGGHTDALKLLENKAVELNTLGDIRTVSG